MNGLTPGSPDGAASSTTIFRFIFAAACRSGVVTEYWARQMYPLCQRYIHVQFDDNGSALVCREERAREEDLVEGRAKAFGWLKVHIGSKIETKNRIGIGTSRASSA